MDKAKLEQYITENMKSVFGYALTRLGNTHEAEELASDIIYEIIKSADNLKNEERFYGFMWRIAGMCTPLTFARNREAQIIRHISTRICPMILHPFRIKS